MILASGGPKDPQKKESKMLEKEVPKDPQKTESKMLEKGVPKDPQIQ